MQVPRVKFLGEQLAAFHKPWIERSLPPTYEHFTNWLAQNTTSLKNVSLADLVQGSCGGSPDTCFKMLQESKDAGINEPMLFMQLYETPHDAIMESLRQIAEKVRPRLNSSTFMQGRPGCLSTEKETL